eukprot:TRINITY_DN495_c0_g1_i1.p1 TRINITY_DN495_c0_g1~~TRINITY_DN495_c0_g1_i1.p1  ORF type:complete len:318 (-),score=88.55 TRINITY_DN495_c0_g1_i1:34-987(-)
MCIRDRYMGYYWILEQLDIYRPFVWEYSRLNVTSTVTSKRKLHKLIHENYVNGWDDPRVPTLNGLRRRGYTSQSINDFCDAVSVTRRGNENIIQVQLLEHFVRKDLDKNASRTMGVLDPVKLILTNLPENHEEKVQAPNFPKELERGYHTIYLHREVYIDREDVKAEDHSSFFGAAPGKIVGLKYAHHFKCTAVKTNEQGEIILVEGELLPEHKDKVKGHLHWVSVKDSLDCEIRLYDRLFLHENPGELDNYIDVLNPQSLVVKRKAKFSKHLKDIKREDKFQFERVGFFSVDYDTCLLYTSPSPRDRQKSRMPSSA